jgi:hypothetical protein
MSSPWPLHNALCSHCLAVNEMTAAFCCKCGNPIHHLPAPAFAPLSPADQTSLDIVSLTAGSATSAANESARTDGDAVSAMSPAAFHVVLGADGSATIEVSPDEVIDQAAAARGVTTGASSESALQAIAESEQAAAWMPRTPPVRASSAPKRQLGWSFVGGALAATVLLVMGYQVHGWWSGATLRWAPATGTEGSNPARAEGIVTGAAPVAAQPAAIGGNAQILVDVPPTAAGRPTQNPPAPRPEPCVAQVAALGLCTPDQAGGP